MFFERVDILNDLAGFVDEICVSMALPPAGSKKVFLHRIFLGGSEDSGNESFKFPGLRTGCINFKKHTEILFSFHFIFTQFLTIALKVILKVSHDKIDTKTYTPH